MRDARRSRRRASVDARAGVRRGDARGRTRGVTSTQMWGLDGKVAKRAARRVSRARRDGKSARGDLEETVERAKDDVGGDDELAATRLAGAQLGVGIAELGDERLVGF